MRVTEAESCAALPDRRPSEPTGGRRRPLSLPKMSSAFRGPENALTVGVLGDPPQYILNVSDLGQILNAFAGDAWTEDPGNVNPDERP